MKEINFNKLLNRPPVEINTQEVSSFLKGKKILVTGASGSIGSELVRQICKFSPKTVVLFDRNENAQFFLENELKLSFPNIQIIPRLGSITDRQRIKVVFEETQPNIVFHCAANKHVPLSESNPSEAIINNIQGTLNLLEAAKTYIEKFIFISTDKSVNPTSVMGATKRVCELIIQSFGDNYITVRFGNVLGSNGSVVPIFTNQIENDEFLTITHPDMLRYFMTIPEATQLLLQAATIGKGGEIFVLDMGEPIKIVELAKTLMKLIGKQVEIKYTGVRPGEKIIEELSSSHETTTSTIHDRIRNTLTNQPNLIILNKIKQLIAMNYNCSPNRLKMALMDIIPEAKLMIIEEMKENFDGSFSIQ